MINLEASFEKAVVNNLSPKSEKKGKTEKQLTYHISFAGEIDQQFMANIAVGKDVPDYKTVFWMDDGALKTTFVSLLAFSREYENHKLEIDLDLTSEQIMTFHKVKLTDFKAIPVFGHQVKASFKATLNPSPTDVEFLDRALLQSVIKVKIQPPDEVDLDQGSLDLDE